LEILAYCLILVLCILGGSKLFDVPRHPFPDELVPSLSGHPAIEGQYRVIETPQPAKLPETVDFFATTEG
jgi:hypothetical protein